MRCVGGNQDQVHCRRAYVDRINETRPKRNHACVGIMPCTKDSRMWGCQLLGTGRIQQRLMMRRQVSVTVVRLKRCGCVTAGQSELPYSFSILRDSAPRLSLSSKPAIIDSSQRLSFGLTVATFQLLNP